MYLTMQAVCALLNVKEIASQQEHIHYVYGNHLRKHLFGQYLRHELKLNEFVKIF